MPFISVEKKLRAKSTLEVLGGQLPILIPWRPYLASLINTDCTENLIPALDATPSFLAAWNLRDVGRGSWPFVVFSHCHDWFFFSCHHFRWLGGLPTGVRVGTTTPRGNSKRAGTVAIDSASTVLTTEQEHKEKIAKRLARDI